MCLSVELVYSIIPVVRIIGCIDFALILAITFLDSFPLEQITNE